MYRILHVLAQRPGRTGSRVFLNSLIHQAARKDLQQAVIVGIPVEENLHFQELEEQYHYPVFFNTPELPFAVAGMSDEMPYNSTRYSAMDEEMLQSWTEAFTEKLQLAAAEFKPQAILTHHLWLLTGLVRKVFPDIPVIAISHGTGLRQLTLAPKLKERVIKGCRNVDLVLALSHFQKEEIILKYHIPSEKIIVTGCAYDSDIFYPQQKTYSVHRNIKLVYCGKLSRAKGVIQLLESFTTLSRTHKNIELILIGSGKDQDARIIKQKAEQSPGKISFTGAVPQADVGKIFRQCDIFILPSFYEGLGLVVLEALASGLKVVTTDIPGLSDWLGETVNNSGQIIYVKMPRMKQIDQPFEEDLESFKLDLERAISKMLKDYRTRPRNNLKRELAARSWEHLFNRVYEQILKLIKEKERS